MVARLALPAPEVSQVRVVLAALRAQLARRVTAVMVARAARDGRPHQLEWPVAPVVTAVSVARQRRAPRAMVVRAALVEPASPARLRHLSQRPRRARLVAQAVTVLSVERQHPALQALVEPVALVAQVARAVAVSPQCRIQVDRTPAQAALAEMPVPVAPRQQEWPATAAMAALLVTAVPAVRPSVTQSPVALAVRAALLAAAEEVETLQARTAMAVMAVHLALAVTAVLAVRQQRPLPAAPAVPVVPPIALVTAARRAAVLAPQARRVQRDRVPMAATVVPVAPASREAWVWQAQRVAMVALAAPRRLGPAATAVTVASVVLAITGTALPRVSLHRQAVVVAMVVKVVQVARQRQVELAVAVA